MNTEFSVTRKVRDLLHQQFMSTIFYFKSSCFLSIKKDKPYQYILTQLEQFNKLTFQKKGCDDD